MNNHKMFEYKISRKFLWKVYFIKYISWQYILCNELNANKLIAFIWKLLIVIPFQTEYANQPFQYNVLFTLCIQT